MSNILDFIFWCVYKFLLYKREYTAYKYGVNVFLI